MNMLIPNMSEAEYHASSAFSSTGAREILESPAKFHYSQTHKRPDKDEYDLGSAVHSKVLGTGYEVVVLDFPDWRTAAARQARDDVRAGGGIPMLPRTTGPVNEMAEAVLSHPVARGMLEQEGTPEMSVFTTDPETGVKVRARFDYLPSRTNPGSPSRVAVDLKTTRDASPNGFARSIASFNYDVQRAWYLDALRFVTGENAEMVFVAVEKEPPYLVAVHQLPTIWAEMGHEKAAAARRIYAECVERNEWPGYGTDIHMPSPPTWLLFEHEAKYDSEEINI